MEMNVMSTPVEFAVMNGLGNKILVVDMRGRRDKVTPEAAIALNAHADTRFDQIMAIHDPKAEGTDAFIDILNSDGSKAQACGNGTRCVVQGACSRDRQEGIHLPDRRRHPECAGTCRWDHFRRYGHARFCLGQDPAFGRILRYQPHRAADRPDRRSGPAFALRHVDGQSACNLLGRS